jgi:membrane-associated phospholipid phosphatase/phytoene/squalene synthetase
MAVSDVRGSGPLFAWPGARNLKLTLPLCWLFLKIFTSVYGGASLLAGFRGELPHLYFAFELDLPFIPAMAVVYLTGPLLLAAAPFVLRTWRDITPFFLTLTAETLIAGLCFLLFPVEQAYPPRIASGLWGEVFRFADALNLDHNEIPSLHVAFAVTAALVFGKRCGPLGRTLFALWAVAVSGSTLLLHEHHLLDVAAGVALAFVAVGTVQGRASSRPFLDVLRIEALCLREAALFTRRHVRYLFTALAIYGFSLPRFRKTRMLRAAWSLAQHVDDVLDGDRAVPGDPEAYAREILRVLDGGEPDEAVPVQVLAAFVRGGVPREKLAALFEELIVDRRRMAERRAMGAVELAEHHRRTFALSLDLTLLLTGAKLKAADAPELVDALAWCSPVRDLEEDWKKGLINVPAEVLAEAGGNLSAPAVRNWLQEEHRRGAAAIAALGAKLPSIPDPRSRSVLSSFHRALAAYERKYRKKNP